MCAAAIVQSRISKVYIGTFNKDMGACGSVISLLDSRRLNSFVDVKWLYDEECSEILVKFFEENLNEYRDWLNIREVTYYIHEMKNTGNSVVESRAKSFENKCKDKNKDLKL